MIEEPNLNTSIFMSELQRILTDPAALQAMRQASASFAKLDAASVLAGVILQLA